MAKTSKAKGQSQRKGEAAEKLPLSKALATLVSYENEDSESPNEDSNDAHGSQARVAVTSSLAMQPRSVLGKAPVKFALKTQSKMQKLGVRPKVAGGDGPGLRVASKWDDDEGNVVQPLAEGNGQVRAKTLQLYEGGNSREATPVSDVPMEKMSKSFNPVDSRDPKETVSTVLFTLETQFSGTSLSSTWRFGSILVVCSVHLQNTILVTMLVFLQRSRKLYACRTSFHLWRFVLFVYPDTFVAAICQQNRRVVRQGS